MQQCLISCKRVNKGFNFHLKAEVSTYFALYICHLNLVFQTELSSVNQRNTTLDKEVSLLTSEHSSILTKVHNVQQENVQLKNDYERMEHQLKIEVANSKLEAVKARGAIERELDENKNQLAGQSEFSI